MNRKIRVLILTMFFVLSIVGTVQCVSAAGSTTSATAKASVKKGWVQSGKYRYYYNTKGKMVTGWTSIGGKYYYFRKLNLNGNPKGSMSTGLCKIYGKYYYFDSDGVLQTGWQTIGGKLYYFEPTGKPSKLGVRYSGVKKIDKYTYRFRTDGSVYTGWYTSGGKKYYYSASSKVVARGRMLTGWRMINGYRYYFNSKGVMQTDCWISGKYYVDSKGHRLDDCVTPDGFVVDKNGLKVAKAEGWIELDGKYYYYKSLKKVTGWQTIDGKKYYFSTDGVRQTGWQTISGKRYYFNASGVRQSGWIKYQGAKYYLKSGVMQTGWQTISNKDYYFGSDGKMAVSTEIDGIKIGADGVADISSKKWSVLIIAGHGQGDCGAIGQYGSTTYYEENFTRQFATLIYNSLKAAGGTKVAVTMYDQNYNFYSVNSNYRVYNKVTGPMPDLTKYDYVLEIHFNATGASSKDTVGNGSYKGIGMYVNSAKSDLSLDTQIVKAAAMAGDGFKIWGGGTGIFRSSTLYNAKICQGLEVSYGLLETAFIDDRDDMNFYNKNKDKMAQEIAKVIVTYFSQKKPVPGV